jgi:hypothetical protein
MNMTPTHRGFDSFYGYFNAQNDYFTHRVGGVYHFRIDTVKKIQLLKTFKSGPDVHTESDGLDYWFQDADHLKPILDQNNTYSMVIWHLSICLSSLRTYVSLQFSYVDRAIDIFENHDPAKPLFMYFASQNTHSPLEVNILAQV